jgi:hypothetical protein
MFQIISPLSLARQYAQYLSVFRLKLCVHFSFLPVSYLTSQFLDGLDQFLDLLYVSFDFLPLKWSTCLDMPCDRLVASITSVISLSQTIKYDKSSVDNKRHFIMVICMWYGTEVMPLAASLRRKRLDRWKKHVGDRWSPESRAHKFLSTQVEFLVFPQWKIAKIHLQTSPLLVAHGPPSIITNEKPLNGETCVIWELCWNLSTHSTSG